jgi:hypothetical protein
MNRGIPRFSAACLSTWAPSRVTTSKPTSCGDAHSLTIPPLASLGSIVDSKVSPAMCFEHLIRIAQRNGDEIVERAVDYVLADEITHVRMGSKWMRKLTEGDPERLAAAQAFQDDLDSELNYRGRRRAREDIAVDDDALVAIARESRLLAGFTEEEIQRLVDSSRRSTAY